MVELKVLKLLSNVSETLNNHLLHGWELAQPIQFVPVRNVDGLDVIHAYVVLRKIEI